MNNKTLSTSALALVAAGGMSLFAGQASAAVNFVPGDLLMGFQATGGVGAGNTYVYNVGQASNFRDNPSVGFLANVNTDLSATFGSDWFTRTDLYWAVGGVRTNAAFGADASSVVNGDPARAIYASKESDGIGTSTAHSSLAVATINTTATRMMDSQLGFRTTNGTTPRDATGSSAGNGVVQGTGDINSWSSRVPVASAPWTTMPTSVNGNFGTGTATANLDLYRALSNTSTSGVTEPTTAGVFTYQTTFTMDNLGNINAVPEPSTTMLGGLIAAVGLLRRRRSK